MKISKSNQFNHTNNLAAGFTLIELLVSISIMGVVLSLVGAGITFMVSADQKLSAAQSRRVEISRALDVITYDIRKSEKAAISADSSMPTLPTGTPVLFLNISIVCNDNTIMPEQVIYSTQAKSSGSSNILYRYGRIADKNDLISCSGNDPVNVPIADNITPATTSPTCIAPTAPSTETGEGTNGFYTCISDNQVSIALFAKLSNSTLVYGDNRTITSGSITTTDTAVGVSAATASTATASTATDCEVPDLLAMNPSAAKTRIHEALIYKGMSLPPSPAPIYGAATGLYASGIAIGSGGSTVISQTPSAGSKIPCTTGLVTYTY